MAQVLRMPSTMELPDGPRRKFVEALFSYYRRAGRPTLRDIAEDIAGDPDFEAFTASRETIRKLLRGKTIPPNWAVVNAVLWVLCVRAGITPEGPHRRGGFAEDRTSHRENLRNLWNEALDAPPPGHVAPSGWGVGAGDEPPF